MHSWALCWYLTWCPFSSAVSPTAGGRCSEDIFRINVKYGSTPRSQLQIKLGQVELNDEVLQEYEHHSNETHFVIIVPFLAPLVALEVFFRFPVLHWWLVFPLHSFNSFLLSLYVKYNEINYQTLRCIHLLVMSGKPVFKLIFIQILTTLSIWLKPSCSF